MKHLVTLLLTVIISTVLNLLSAQTNEVAILSHEGNITTFNGGNGLRDAVAAAVEGDIITLSAGNFIATDIAGKKLTIRGAGMDPDNNPTIVTGDIYITCKTAENVDNVMTIEGCLFTGYVFLDRGTSPLQSNNIHFIKNRFANMVKAAYANNITFTNCFIYSCNTYNYSSMFTYINSVIENKGSETTLSAYYNCVIKGSYITPTNHKFSNCIIVANYPNSIYLDASSQASGSIYIGNSTDFFKNSLSSTNRSFGTDTQVFKEGTTTYELTEENAANWLGTDGTQVGIYGGALPFDPTTSNPQISKFNVASKTTADGKLSVDIEVKAN